MEYFMDYPAKPLMDLLFQQWGKNNRASRIWQQSQGHGTQIAKGSTLHVCSKILVEQKLCRLGRKKGHTPGSSFFWNKGFT